MVVRVGGHPPAGRSAGQPVAPERYVDEPSAMNVRSVGVQRFDGYVVSSWTSRRKRCGARNATSIRSCRSGTSGDRPCSVTANVAANESSVGAVACTPATTAAAAIGVFVDRCHGPPTTTLPAMTPAIVAASTGASLRLRLRLRLAATAARRPP